MSRKQRIFAMLVLFVPASADFTWAADEIDFSHDIVPVLKKRCGECHLGDKKKGGFSMNDRADLLAGSENGEVLELGKGTESYLIELLTTGDVDIQMPPKGDRVPAEEVALLTNWIDRKLPWEEGFSFGEAGWEPPLRPREVKLPPVTDGRDNPVDRILDESLATNGIFRPGPVSDASFMRRLFLDVIGVLPTPEELDVFLSDKSGDKRAKMVDAVLNRDVDYAEHWLTFWNDLLRNVYVGTGYIDGGRKQITDWLYRSLVDNKPYHQLVRELIAPRPDSEGFIQGIKWRGNVNASQTREIQFAQNLSQVFLGINMKCASCHDSFIDRWKLDDAYKLAAVYATEPVEIHRCDKPTGEIARAAWIFPELGEVDPEKPQTERLEQLASLMTHPENGRFTRTIVNRIWHRLMGRGIVHPVDAMHTEPWNEDLLDFLALHLRDHEFDLKATIRLVVNSEAYQSQMASERDHGLVTRIIDVAGQIAGTAPVRPAVRFAFLALSARQRKINLKESILMLVSSEAYQSGLIPEIEEGREKDYVYRGPIARRMTAEQFIDAVWQITGTAPDRPAVDLMRMKIELGEHEDVLLAGKWIWANHGEIPAAGETITVRKEFELEEKPDRAQAVITVDNEYQVFVNGRKIREDGNWMTVETLSIGSALKGGENEILIVAKNAGDSPNAAAVYFEMHATFESPESKAWEIRLASDDSWQWTRRKPDRRGQFGNRPVVDWAPVAVINGKTWANRTGAQLKAGLSADAGGGGRMVRASLVKSDLLMRSLGRPNREQVVTVRPEQLTTLQAIDLANGEILSKTLGRGGSHLMLENAERSPEELAGWLFEFGLGRKPTDQELAVLSELTGPELTQQGAEDLLWSVVMLPEFQLIR